MAAITYINTHLTSRLYLLFFSLLCYDKQKEVKEWNFLAAKL